jgi:glycosyltransferase involved in cell wall biosynthesis
LIPREHEARLLFITTSHATMGSFFNHQLAFFASQGFHVLAVSSPGPGLDRVRAAGVDVLPLAMERQPNPIRDLGSLVALRKLIAKFRPHIVHAHTPKAGLLGMMAAANSRVPVRLYTVHGLPLLTRTGWRRYILEYTERIACRLSTRTYCISPSLESLMREMKLCPPGKLFTLGDGSCAGVDLERFSPPPDAPAVRRQFRAAHGIASDAVLLCYVGRVARDKGIEVLANAWKTLSAKFAAVHLLICGTADRTDPVPRAAMTALQRDPRVHFTPGWLPPGQMPTVYTASDICVLPTYREGLSQVALESSAMEVPVAGTRIPGLVSAVQDEVTGLLVPAGDAPALSQAVGRLVADEALRRKLGAAGRQFVTVRFSEARVNQMYLEEYRNLLRNVKGANHNASPNLQFENVRKP